MTSLRRFLLIAVLATLVLVNFGAALHGYKKSMAAAQALFDDKLAAFAEQLLAIPVAAQAMPPAPTSEGSGSGPMFQLIDSKGSVYWRSDNAPIEVLPGEPGFSDGNYQRFRWRFYVAETPGQRRVVVAERLDQRFKLAESIVLESVLPVLLGLPAAGLLIWLIVGYGLKPLTTLARTLQGKSSSDLAPVSLPVQPQELAPVVASLNAMLARLDAAFERERRFSADAAHELRTPIAAIRMHLHNAIQDPDTAAPSLAQLQSDVQRLSHLVEQMLAMHRISPDSYPAKFESIDLLALSQAMISRYYPLFQAKSQSITLSGAAAYVQGDRFALDLLLQNLLSNANKYTPDGGQVEVVVEEKGEGCCLSVRDDGPGIAAEEQSRIFERFYRVGGDRHSSGEEGCGLGLSIVADIVALHGATVSLDQGIGGRGVSVSVHFPKGETQSA